MTYCFFKISTKPALVRSLPCTAVLKSSMTSGGIKRFGGFGGLAAAELSSLGPRAFGLFAGSAVLGNKRFVRLRVWSGIRGGSMEIFNDCGRDVSIDLNSLWGCQYAVE